MYYIRSYLTIREWSFLLVAFNSKEFTKQKMIALRAKCFIYIITLVDISSHGTFVMKKTTAPCPSTGPDEHLTCALNIFITDVPFSSFSMMETVPKRILFDICSKPSESALNDLTGDREYLYTLYNREYLHICGYL